MKMVYENNNVFGLDEFGITDIFNIDTNSDEEFQSFGIYNDEIESVDEVIVLMEDKVVIIREEDILAGDAYNSLDSWQQKIINNNFIKDFLEEKLTNEEIINCEDNNYEKNFIIDSVKALEEYGINVEKLIDESSTLCDNVATYGEVICEGDSDGGFFNSLFGAYDKSKACALKITLLDKYYNVQWAI